MAGSSLRNALHRRNHKERAQLVGRSRLGLLEKKKDYVQRAKDYHSKQDRIHRLQEKAAMRNKDEFYFSMVKSKTEGGVHVQDRGNAPIPVDTVKLLKSQDENYIRTMRATGLKRIAALKLELSNLVNLLSASGANDDFAEDDFDETELDTLRSAGLLANPVLSSSSSTKRKRADEHTPFRGSHVVFVNNVSDAKKYHPPQSRLNHISLEASGSLDITTEEEIDLGWKATEEISSAAKRRKGKNKAVTATAASAEESETARRVASQTHRKQLLKELAARLERDASLKDALLEIKNQRLRMQNGSKKLIESSKGKANSEDSGEGAEGGAKGFTFNMSASDDDNDDDGEGSGQRRTNGESKWKPKVYKWKFERSR